MVIFFPKVRDMVHRHWDEKYAQTIGVIDTMLLKYHPRQQMVAFSGGKDSTLVLYLLMKQCEDFGIDIHDIPVIGPPFAPQETGAIEYPETYAFCKMLAEQWGLNYIEQYSPYSFWDYVETRGLPGVRGDRRFRSSNCCELLKIQPMRLEMKCRSTKVLYLGTTAPESYQRQVKAISLGQIFAHRKFGATECLPILYWTESEVWRFTREHDIPYNGIYERGADRCGCACCTAYKGWDDQMSRLSPELYVRVKSLGGEI